MNNQILKCGTTENNVREMNCPYQAELYEKRVKVVLCKRCYQERMQEI